VYFITSTKSLPKWDPGKVFFFKMASKMLDLSEVDMAKMVACALAFGEIQIFTFY